MSVSINDLIKQALDAANLNDRDRMLVRQFTGFKGTKNDRGAQRYYLNDQFNEYVDVVADDVVGELQLGGEASPFVLVLVKADAAVQHHVDVSETVSAQFLAGEIAARNLLHARIGDPSMFGDGGYLPPHRLRGSLPCGSGVGDC